MEAVRLQMSAPSFDSFLSAPAVDRRDFLQFYNIVGLILCCTAWLNVFLCKLLQTWMVSHE